MPDIQTHIEPRLSDSPCEESIERKQSFITIFDGASSLEETITPSDYDSNGQWFSRVVTNRFTEQYNHESQHIQKTLFETLRETRKEYEKLFKKNPTQLEKPCGAMAVASWSKGLFEYYVLSDCTILLDTYSMGLLKITDPGPSPLDKQVETQWADKFDGGSRPDGMNDQIKQNRAIMNTLNGYNAVTIDPKCAYNGVHGTIPTQNIKYALMFTDGFKPTVEAYKQFDSWNEVLDEIIENGLEKAVTRIRKYEKEDATLKDTPRLKQSDDIGVVFLDFT